MTTSFDATKKLVKTCKLCEHDYIHPCHGKNKECSNALWVKSGRNLKEYNKLYGAMHPTFTVPVPKEKKSKRRTRLESGPSKAKRVRL